MVVVTWVTVRVVVVVVEVVEVEVADMTTPSAKLALVEME